jgi:hypothetical protein
MRDDIETLCTALERDGHVTVSGLVDTETISRYRLLVANAVSQADRLDVGSGNEAYRRAFDQYMNLWQVDDAMCELTLDPFFGAFAARLLGVDAVRVYHDQALIKLAGGGGTPWHQDHWYWPLDTDRVITMWLPLHDVDGAMGDLEFAAGTHAGPIGDAGISADADAFYERHVIDRSLDTARTGAMAAGDASFHLGWTLHRARPNTTERDREVMTVIWFADGVRVTEPTNDGQHNDLRSWLPGCAPGDVASTEINPLLSAFSI